MVVRVYPVYDLVIPMRNYPYPSNELPSVGAQGSFTSHFGTDAMGGGLMGGTGGMGGMGGMGGGFFAMPDRMGTPPQATLGQMAKSR